MLVLRHILLTAEVPLAVAQRGQGEQHHRQDDGQEPGPHGLRHDTAHVVGDVGIVHRVSTLFHGYCS